MVMTEGMMIQGLKEEIIMSDSHKIIMAILILLIAGLKEIMIVLNSQTVMQTEE